LACGHPRNEEGCEDSCDARSCPIAYPADLKDLEGSGLEEQYAGDAEPDGYIPDIDWVKLHTRPRFAAVANAAFGVSIENEETFQQRAPYLHRLRDVLGPWGTLFLSVEPLIGPISWRLNEATRFWYTWKWGNDEVVRHAVDWVICGGESGPGARPMHPDWVRSLRDQCAAAGVSFFFKQWGEWAPMMDSVDPVDVVDSVDTVVAVERGIYVESLGDSAPQGVQRVGKKAAGRVLDGVEHSAWPAGFFGLGAGKGMELGLATENAEGTEREGEREGREHGRDGVIEGGRECG